MACTTVQPVINVQNSSLYTCYRQNAASDTLETAQIIKSDIARIITTASQCAAE